MVDLDYAESFSRLYISEGYFRNEHHKLSTLVLPADKSVPSNLSFLKLVNIFNDVVEKTPEALRYFGDDGMRKLYKSLKDALKVFEKCILGNILVANYNGIERTKQIDLNDIELLKQIKSLEGLKIFERLFLCLPCAL